MIFLSLGTHEQPFARAIDLLRPLAAAGEPVIVQHGSTEPVELPQFRWQRFMAYGEVVAMMREARAVVCHAGVGTVMTALKHGITPVVLSRRHALGEHVDDHQGQLAARLEGCGLVVHADDDVPAAIERATRQRPPICHSRGALFDAVARLVGAPVVLDRRGRPTVSSTRVASRVG